MAGEERKGLLLGEALLSSRISEENNGGYAFVIWTELKKMGYIAGPMVLVNMFQYLLQVISLMMVGHLGELSLSSAAIACSLASVSGFTVMIGMASALETLCGQAYGADQYQRLAIQTQRAVVSLLIFCFPISLVWIFMGKLLCFIGQDPLIASEAGKYSVWLIPGLFAFAVIQPLTKFLQSQSLTLPLLFGSSATIFMHVPVCWVLVFKSGLGNVGAALAISISYWFYLIFLVLYVKFSPTCEKTRAPLSKEAFRGITDFLKLALPSALMICLEYWSFELLILSSGLLPNPQLETSVLSVCLTTLVLVYNIPYGLSAAVSTRVANELGAGYPQAASFAVRVTMVVAVTEAVIVSTTIFSTRYVLGYAFSSEKEVVEYVTRMAPLLALSMITDSLQGVLSGVARGCGWQHIGAYINLAAFYLVGIPLAGVLAFVLGFGGRGLWIGIFIGSAVQTILLALITCFTNWESQANKARQQVFDGKSFLDGSSIITSKMSDQFAGCPAMIPTTGLHLAKESLPQDQLYFSIYGRRCFLSLYLLFLCLVALW